MLREIPSIYSHEQDAHVTMDADMTTDEARPYVDPLDDVFGSSPTSPASPADGNHGESSALANESSDIRRLRTTHVTNGYREGIAQSKDQHIQAGFDEGYSLGAEMGLKVGWCLGVLDGVHRALAMRTGGPATPSGEEDSSTKAKQKLQIAQEELKMEKLFDKAYFGGDGVWLYDVPGQDQEGAISFEEVAAAHPVIREWTIAAGELAHGSGIAVRR
ncbi:hypothetical protein MBLNU230_g3116t1 [Neophaeotheca triangularis]